MAPPISISSCHSVKSGGLASIFQHYPQEFHGWNRYYYTNLIIVSSVCMFDKFHLTFNFKFKVSHDVFKNKKKYQLTYTFYPKISPQFWVTQYYFRKTYILNNQNTILICKQKKLSIEDKYPLVSHVSPNGPIHCIHFKPTKRDPHKSIKGLQVRPIAQVAFNCILFGKSSLTNN